MTTIFTALPHFTNEGRDTTANRLEFFLQINAAGVLFTADAHCKGLWYSDEGTLYEESVTFVEMWGPEAVLRKAVCAIGSATQQKEMLFVPSRCDGSIVAAGEGYDEACRLAKEYGGATLFPGGYAASLRYASLVAGKDY